MAELRAAARRPGAASAAGYGDVFGGPTRYGARLGDYDDVFGGLSSSCSIPVLDLPPAAEAYDAPRRSALDYGEIFGGLEVGYGVPTYEELVAAKERAEPGIAAARSRKEKGSGQQTTEVRQLSPDRANKNHAACLEKDRIISTANYSNGCSMQHDMPYYKPSQGDIEEAGNETTRITQPRVFYGFTSDIDASQPSQRIRTDVPPYMANVDISLNASSNDRISDQKQGDSFSSSSSATSSKSSGNGLRLNQTQLAPKHPTLVDGPANTKHHSRSSSNHSTSSGDMYYPDFTYVSVSDISLQTQPAQKPPPSRSPPKLANNQEISKMKICANSKVVPDEASLSKPILNHRKHSVWDAPKRLAPQVPPRDSSFFFDVEVDANSAAAASAAAMKEAMEQAQARLKSAKESMERKRDNLQNRKKMGRNEGTKCENGKDVKPTQEIKMFNEVENQKIFSKEKKKNEFVPEARQKAREAAKVAPEDEEKEILVVSYEQDQQMVEPKGFTSPQACCKLDDRTGEWKIDEQFYELVHNEKRFNVVTELSVKKIAEKVPEETKKVDFEIECKVSEFSPEFERNENLLKVSESHKCEEKKSKTGDRAFVEEKKELPKTSPNIFVQEETENRLEKGCDFHVPVEDESKLGKNQEAYAREEEIKKPKFAKDAPACREADVKLKCLIDACNFEVTGENIENGLKLEVAKEACEYDTNLELNKNHVTCLPHDSEKKPGMANENDIQAEKDEIKVPYASCTLEARDKVEAAPEMNPYEDSSKAREKTTLDCSQEENGKKLKGLSLVSEQHESAILNTTEYASTFAESNFKVEVAEEACETEENLEELQSAEMGIRSRKTEMIEAVEWEDYDENEATDAQLELQQDANEQTTIQVPCEPLVDPLLSVAVRLPEKENDGTGEIHLNVDMKEKYNIFNVAQEVLRRVVNKDVEAFREAKMFEKKDKMPISSQNTTQVCPYVRPEQSVPDLWKVEERGKERRIQREELEKARRLEEEREREREREKDRIAVERATREAHERSVAEAREKVERIAVERVTAEARQRALAEAREKAEKASAEALERSLAEKSARESRLRAERAAVERATAEARERAAERALAEKAAADARERAEKLNAGSNKDKMRRGNETEAHSRARFKADSGTRDTPDLTHDMQYKNQRHMDSYNHGEGESALRCKARLERHQRTVERAAKALAEKNTRDIIAQREQAERNRLAEMLDADVRRWSTGKEGNLRALLSTLQYILGPESGWQPIPLTDVITAAAVKKGYRKATLCVHPDKLQQRGANIQQKYICEKIFDLLKDAWNRFNSEER